MKLIRILAIAALMATGVSAAADKPTIHVVADEWPPFSGTELHKQGLSIHVISAVFEHAGYHVESSVLPWARIMDGAERNEFDVIGSLFFDEAMTEHVVYSDPFYSTPIQLVQPKGTGYEFKAVKELGDFNIAVGDGFLYEEEFDKADYLNKITVKTALQALQMVAFGRADMTLDSVDVVNFSIKHLDPSLSEKLELVPGVMTKQNIHMAMRLDFPNLDKVLNDFNMALAELRESGELEELLSHHVHR